MHDSAFAEGPYGDASLVLKNSANALTQFGIPRSLAETTAIHPLVDAQFAAGHGGAGRPGKATELTPETLTPIEGDPTDISRWFRRDHSLDGQLAPVIQSRLRGDARVTHRAVDPDATFKERIIAADTLLHEALPETWANTKPFVNRIYQTEEEKLSGASWDDLGGTCVVGSTANANTFDLAASLLHESAHNKSYRIFRSFEHVMGAETSEFIDIPWWKSKESAWRWDVGRAFVAAHVYAHVAALAIEAHDLLPEEQERLRQVAQRTAFRSQYLTNVLLQLPTELLDSDRMSMLEWINSTIPRIEGINEAGRRALEVSISTFPRPEIIDA